MRERTRLLWQQLRATSAPLGVPGRELHDQVVADYARAMWGWGAKHAGTELAATLSRSPRFADAPRPRGPEPAEAIAWAAARIELQGKWHRSLDERVNAVIVSKLSEGATIEKAIKSLRQVLPTFSKARLENIVRTESGSAYNAGRMAAFKANRWVAAVQFTAILDDRTTGICRDRDGRIMRIDDPALEANTPPLHFQCRSTLVAIDKFDFEYLEAGDEELEDRFFGHLEGPNRPRNLREAMNWNGLSEPMAGFGGPPAGPNPAPDPPPPVDLKAMVTEALGGGSLAELRAAGAILRQEILASTSHPWHIEKVLDTLSQVRSFGEGPRPTYTKGTRDDAKRKVEMVWRMLPTDYQVKMSRRPISVSLRNDVRAHFSGTRQQIVLNRADTASVTLHEIGHWMEDTGIGKQSLLYKAEEFLEDRTLGETPRRLSELTGIAQYSAREVARPDRFTNPYIGKEYRNSFTGGVYATEVTSMALEAVFFQKYNAWQQDLDLIDFMLGALVYCSP